MNFESVEGMSICPYANDFFALFLDKKLKIYQGGLQKDKKSNIHLHPPADEVSLKCSAC